MSGRAVALDMTIARLGRAGPHVYASQLARALAPRLGARLLLIGSRLAQPPGVRRTAGDRLRTLGRDLGWHQVGVTLAARRAGAGLLHLPAGFGPVRAGLPTVVTIHDLLPFRFPRSFRTWHRTYTRIVLPRVARAARAVITVSDASRRDVVELLGVAEDRVTVVPNGVDPVFAPVPPESDAAQDARRRLGLPGDFVLAVGAIEPRKNLARLLRAIRALRSRPATADIRLIHAGPEAWLSDDLPGLVRELDLSDTVRFLGYVSAGDLATLFSLARVFVYPSLGEGFGIPVVEAMACGCPVVTSNVSSLPEVAGGAAALVDPASVEEIADAVGALWRDEARRRDLAARGRVRAAAFTWERTARETAAVYDAACA